MPWPHVQNCNFLFYLYKLASRWLFFGEKKLLLQHQPQRRREKGSAGNFFEVMKQPAGGEIACFIPLLGNETKLFCFMRNWLGKLAHNVTAHLLMPKADKDAASCCIDRGRFYWPLSSAPIGAAAVKRDGYKACSKRQKEFTFGDIVENVCALGTVLKSEASDWSGNNGRVLRGRLEERKELPNVLRMEGLRG